MPDPPSTRPSLLARIRDAQDQEAWRQFVQLYSPVVYGYARRRGLQDADAGDLTQEVLRAVCTAAEKFAYDSQRGSFRGWLFTVTRHEVNRFLARQARQPTATGDSDVAAVLASQPAPDEEAQWQQEYEQRLFTWAAEQVRPAVQPVTWQAFWMTAVEGKSGEEVARALGLSVAAVYLAKGRVMARLKEQVQRAEEQ